MTDVVLIRSPHNFSLKINKSSCVVVTIMKLLFIQGILYKWAFACTRLALSDIGMAKIRKGLWDMKKGPPRVFPDRFLSFLLSLSLKQAKGFSLYHVQVWPHVPAFHTFVGTTKDISSEIEDSFKKLALVIFWNASRLPLPNLQC